jgi:hypothetical protein
MGCKPTPFHRPFGTTDRSVGSVGLPGSGKSTTLTALMLDAHAAAPGFMLAADAGGRIPRQLPDGRPTGLVRYASPRGPAPSVASQIAAMRERFSVDARGIHVLRGTDATPLLALAQDLVSSTATDEDANGDAMAIPVRVLVDEAMLWEEIASERLGDNAKDILVSRRWAHVELFWGTQSPERIHMLAFQMASELRCFRIDSMAALRRMRDGGIPENVLGALPKLRAPPPANQDPAHPRDCLTWIRGATGFVVVNLVDGTIPPAFLPAAPEQPEIALPCTG